ncbi:MAG: fibronectin type III domain-containing protein [Bacteroidales bacterium]|nr:fibronectin type III domain-containing protein [Bacteroidales bacterium]
MKRLFTIMLFAAMLLPWTMQGQIMPSYTFRTGVDSTKWITLDATATQIFGATQDDQASSVIDFGFNFQFGEDYYHQFSVSTNGLFTLGPVAAGTSNGYAKFSSSNNFPKIIGVGKDLGTCTGGYIKYQIVGQAPSRTLVVEYKTGHHYTSTNIADVFWQVQLHEDSNKVVLVYGPTAPATIPSSYQSGLGVSINDFLIINPSTNAITHHTASYSTSTSAWHGINRYYEFVAPVITCAKPASVELNNITDASVDVSWQEMGTATQWIIEYGTTGFVPGTGSSDIANTASYSLTGLAPNTAYDIYVSSYCSASDTSNRTKVSFTTACGLYDNTQLPLIESFETWTTAAAGDCFVKGHSGGSSVTTNYPSVSTSYATDGSKSLYMYSTTAYASWVVFPEFTTPVNQLQISFWMRSSSTSYPLIVAVVPNVSNMDVFDTIAIVKCSATSVFEQFVIPLSLYQGNGGRIALISPNGVTSSPYVDNVKIELLPPCPRPMNLSAYGIDQESAVVKWANTGANDFEVQYGPIGFTLGTGTIESAVGDSAVLYNLPSGADYHAYVRASCIDDSSAWIGPVWFRTSCGVYSDTLPYIDGFEAYTASSAMTALINPCWNRLNTISTSTNYPYVSTTYAATGTKSLYMYGTASGYSTLVLNEFQESITNLQLSFKMYRATTSSVSPIMVGIMTDPDSLSTFDTIAIIQNSINGVWETIEIPLDGYNGSGSYIAISTIPGQIAYVYIDDITISEISNGVCPAPVNVVATNITTTSADITWQDNSGSSWIVEYGPAGFELGTGTVEYTSSASISLLGLTPSTGYDVYVRTECSDTTSVYVYGSFRTECGETLELPFIETFDGYGFSSDGGLQCWLYGSTYSTSYPQISASYHSSGMTSLYMYSYKSSSATTEPYPYTYIVAPPVDGSMVSVNSLQVSFKKMVTSSGTSYPGTVIVGVVSDTANLIGTFYPIDTIAYEEEDVWEEYDVSLANYPVDSTGTYIVLLSYPITSSSSSGYNYVYIDDLMIDYLPTCTRPQSIQVVSTTSDAATVQWFDDNASNTSWDIAYGPSGFDPDSIEVTQVGTIVSVTGVSGDSTTVQNLTSGTAYDFYIRTNCGGEYSTWRGPAMALPGSYAIPATGMASVTGCNIILTDDGGLTDGYSANCSGYMVVYPGSQDSLMAIVGGTIYTESCCDEVKIYDGVGIGGALLLEAVGEVTITDTIKSSQGPLTIQLTCDGSVQYDGFVLMMACVEAPTCPNVQNIQVSHVAPHSAYVTWEYSQGAQNIPASYILEVEDALGNINTINTTESSYLLSGLDVQSVYTVRVKTVCDDSEGIFDSVAFSTSCYASIESDTISGATAGTSYYIPVNNYYSNSYTQQLVLASEMNGANVLSSIMFEYNYSSAMTVKTNVSIYLSHTTATSLTTSAWEPLTNAQLVYTGDLNCSQGWNEFEFASPFAYNGTDNLVITIVDLSGDYNSSSYTFRTHSATGMALYYQTDGTMNIPPTSRTAYNYRANMKFVACDNTVNITCPAPNVIVTNVEPHQVDVIWAPGNTESSWDLEYRAAGDSAWTVAATATTSTSYSFTNLMSSTNYQFKVVALCGSEETEQIVSLTTPCDLVSTYPFTENFDTWTASSSANYGNICWGRLTNYSSSTRYPYVSASYSRSPSNSVYFYGSTSTYSAMVLPKFDLPVDTLVINFAMYITSASYQLQVGVMTDPTDMSTFVPVGIAHPTTVSQWQNFEFILNSYNGPDGYIAIAAPQGATAYGYVDNVEVYPIPSCPRPTNVTVDAASITLNSAIVSWTDSVATSWTVEYGPRGFALGTGTSVSVNTTTYTLQGLDHSTYYDVYVTAQCSSTDVSYASFPATFSTLCGTMEFPMFEDFTGYQTGSSTSVPHFPLCWNGGGYSTTYPYISSGTGIDGTTTTYEYMYAYAATADRGTKYTYLALPAIDSTMYQMSDLMVSFVTRAGTISSSYDARLYVGVATNPTDPTTFVAVDTIERTTTDWVEISELELSSYSGSGKYIVFWVCPQTASYSTFYIDDIEVDVTPTCWRPQDLHITDATATSVELAWTERNNATSWTIEYVPAGQSQGTGTTVAANSNPFTVTGLTATTHYDFYVKSNCSATDESRYTRKVSGWTTQVPANVPYAYDFENATEWGNWTTTSNTTSNWYRGTATAAQGSNAIYVSADGGATNSTIDGVVNATAYRDFNFGANDTNFTLTFKAKAGGRTDGNYDGLMLYLVDPWLNAESSPTGLNTPWGNVNNLPRVNGLFVRLDTVYDEYAVELDAVSGVKRLAFYYFNQTHAGTFVGGPAAVDDINIDYTTCPRPTHVTATNLTPNSATITWGGSASGYYVYYRAEDQQSIDSIYTTSNTITLTNLTSNTSYLLAVKSICGNEMSIFSETIQFYTPQVLAQVPYYCGFEATESETSQWAMVNGAAANGWCIGTAAADSGSASLYVTNDFTNKPNAYTITSGSVAWAYRDFYLPTIDTADNFQISFRWKGMGENNYDYVNVYIGPVSGVPTAGATTTITVPTGATLLRSNIQDESDEYGAAYSYITENINLSGANYGGGNYRIYLCWRNDGSVGEQPPISIDNFRILAPESSCATPVVTVAAGSTSAVLTFDAVGNYEVSYKAAADAVWSPEAQVSNASSYTITGLAPEANYEYRVRRLCDDATTSNWAMGTFMTEELPCLAPTAITASNIEMTSATISWTSATASQEAWQVAYGYGHDASAWDTIMVTAATANLTGLYANTQYSVLVRTVCSISSGIYSDWSDPFTFNTAACAIPTNVVASNVTASAATITWSAAAGQTKWQISYGFEGVNEENGTIVNVEGTPSYTLEGLDYETTYDVYVRAICADGIYSAWTQRSQFTTDGIGIDAASNDNVSVRIYPNPANTEATITVEGISGKVEFVVADMNGRMIVTETIACEGSLVKSIDVSNLAKGAYFVHIYNDNFNTTRKLIVK